MKDLEEKKRPLNKTEYLNRFLVERDKLKSQPTIIKFGNDEKELLSSTKEITVPIKKNKDKAVSISGGKSLKLDKIEVNEKCIKYD